ncbi:MAG TPA: hypothetical protein VK530_09120 [Candidatus Acidoferrum sp.]|nr:hypothetical protein [Candidatus Acidoferrum sp.]
MKNTLPTTLVLTAATLLVCATASAENQTNAPARPLAKFTDDPAKGRDPFFPDSMRRSQVIAQTEPTSTNVAQVVNTTMPILLKGISGTTSQRYALINNATFAVGEAAEVRSAGQVVKILLREIRDRSVLIEIVGTGELRELKLREGI